MADTICGPSNALQSFQKHSSIDRTLQQDRLTSRHSPGEGFRSSSGPGAGSLDAEFEAFQASSPFKTGYPEPPSFHHDRHANSSQGNFQQPDWASDFQDMQLHERQGSPLSSAQFHQHALLQRTAPDGWHQDFLRQSGQLNKQPSRHIQPVYQSSLQNMTAFSPTTMPMYNYNELLARASNSGQKDGNQHPSREDEVFSEAFQKAEDTANYMEQLKNLEEQSLKRFQFAKQEMDDVEEREIQAAKQGEHVENLSGLISGRNVKPVDDLTEAASQPAPVRIGSDRILDEEREQGEEHTAGDDANELARTAGNLLESVKSDTSKKFQESNFLSLMRQLRDREVTVDGDNIVNTTQPLHPGGTHYPHDTALEGGPSVHLDDDEDLFRSPGSESLA